MAGPFPTVIASTSSNVATNGTDHIVNLPTGYNVKGRLLLVFFATDAAPSISWPSGWDSLIGGGYANSTNSKLDIGYRVTDGTESESHIHVTTGASEQTAHVSYLIGPFYTSATLADFLAASTTATGASTNPNPGSLNPANWDIENTLWAAVAGWDYNRSLSGYPYADNNLYTRANTTNGCGVGACTTPSAAASLDPGNFTIGVSDDWIAVTVGIRPPQNYTIAPSAITTGQALGTAVISRRITPSGITSAAALGSASVKLPLLIRPTGISAPGGLGTVAKAWSWPSGAESFSWNENYQAGMTVYTHTWEGDGWLRGVGSSSGTAGYYGWWTLTTTFEGLGVPAGSTITRARVTSCITSRSSGNSACYNNGYVGLLVDSYDDQLLNLTELLNGDTSSDEEGPGSWSSTYVDGLPSDHAVSVRLNEDNNVDSPTGGYNTWNWESVEIEIEYSGPGGASTVGSPTVKRLIRPGAISSAQAIGTATVSSGTVGEVPTLVQQKAGATAGDQSSLTITLDAPSKRGNALILQLGSHHGWDITGITGGGTWQELVISGAHVPVHIWACFNCVATTQVVVTFESAQDAAANVSEWSNVSCAQIVPGNTIYPFGWEADGVDNTPHTLEGTPAVVPAVALAGTYKYYSRTLVSGPSDGFTALNTAQGNDGSYDYRLWSAYKVLSSIAAISTSWVLSDTDGWDAPMVILWKGEEFTAEAGGSINSWDADYADARAGSNLAVSQNFGEGQIITGQYYGGGTPEYDIWEAFLEFDTSYISSRSTITSAILYCYNYSDHEGTETRQARLYDFGDALTTADWIPGASLSGYTLLGEQSSPWDSGFNKFSDIAFAANINKTGKTRIIIASSRQASGNAPTSTEEYVGINTTTRPPILVVTYTTPPRIVASGVASGEAFGAAVISGGAPQVVLCGLECAPGTGWGANVTRHWSGSSVTTIVDTPTVAGSKRALKLTAAGAAGDCIWDSQSMDSKCKSIHFAVRVEDLPSTDATLLTLVNGSGTNSTWALVFTYDQASSKFTISSRSNWANRVLSSVIVEADRYYIIDLEVDGINGTVDWWVNLIAQTQHAIGSTNLLYGATVLGQLWATPVAPASYVAYFDDFVWVSDIVSYPLPLDIGSIVGYRVLDTSGTHNLGSGDFRAQHSGGTPSTWVISNGDASGALLNLDIAPTKSHENWQDVPDANAYIEYIYDTAKVNQAPFAVSQVVIACHDPGASVTQKVQLYDGVTAGDSALGPLPDNTTDFLWEGRTWAKAPSGGAWTIDKLKAARLRWGFAHDGTWGDPTINFTVLEVAFPVQKIQQGYPTVVLGDRPLAYWRFSEPSGTGLKDTAGSADGTFYGVGYTRGVAGLLADPSDLATLFYDPDTATAQVEVLGIPAGSPVGASFEVWTKFTALGDHIHTWLRWGKQGTSRPYHWFYYEHRADQAPDYHLGLQFWTPVNSYVWADSATWSPNTGQLYHIVAVHDYLAREVRFYIDGAFHSLYEASDTAVPGAVEANDDSRLGTYASSAHHLDGVEDELAIYPYVLTPAQVAAHYDARSHTGIASAQAFGTATVSVSSIVGQIKPSGIASAQAMGSIILKATARVSATGIVTAQALGTTVAKSTNKILPSGLASAQAIGSLTFKATNRISPSGIASAQALGTLTVAKSVVKIIPSGVNSAQAIGTATLVAPAASLSISPTGITSAQAIGSEIVGFSVPGTIDSTGATDVAAALNAWIASIPAHSVLLFKSTGTYRLDTGLHLDNKHYLELIGNSCTLQAGAGTASNTSLFQLHNTGGICSYITFHGFDLIGTSPTPGVWDPDADPDPEFQYGISNVQALQVEVYDVTVTATGGDAFYGGGGFDTYWIHDCHVYSCGRNGVSVITGSNLLVEDNYFDVVAYSTFDVEPNNSGENSYNLVFRNNIIGTAGYAGFFNASGSTGTTIDNVTVTGNLITADSMDTAVTTERGGGTVRTNFTFTNNTSQVNAYRWDETLHFNHVDGLTITGNVQPKVAGSNPFAYICDCTAVIWDLPRIQLDCSGIGTAAAFGSVVSKATNKILPSGIVTAQALGSAVTKSTNKITPAGIATAQALGTTVSKATSKITPTGISTAQALGSATAKATGRILLSSVVSAQAIGTASVLRGGNRITTTGVVSAQAIGTATLIKGVVKILPTGLTTAEIFGAISLATGILSVRPNGIVSAGVFGSLTVVRGAVRILTAAITSVAALGSATVRASNKVTGTGITSSQALGAAAILRGTVKILPTGVTSTQAFGSVTVRIGAALIRASGITSGETIGLLRVFQAGTYVVVSGIPSTQTLGSVTLRTSTRILTSGISTSQAVSIGGNLRTSARVVPTGITSEVAYGASVVATNARIQAGTITSSQAFGLSVLIQSLPPIVPGPITSLEIFGLVATVSANSIIPTFIPSAGIFGSAGIRLARSRWKWVTQPGFRTTKTEEWGGNQSNLVNTKTGEGE